MTNIVFYHISKEVPSYAEWCIKSIRKHMPHARIIQLTDMDTPEFMGVDEVRRSIPKHEATRETVNYIGYQYLSEMDINPSVFIDPDMIFNGSIGHLLNYDCDVLLATRANDDPVPAEYHIMFPWCSLMVVKNLQFWKDCYEILKRLPEQDWVNNMLAVRLVIRSGKYKTKVVDGNIYNALPFQYSKDVIVYHYKLSDKSGMKAFCEQNKITEVQNYEHRTEKDSFLLQRQG